MIFVQLFAALAGIFALLLLVLPTVRVAQGRLAVSAVIGLWISGAGFGLLAMAGLVLSGDDARAAVLLGAGATVVGWMVQRSAQERMRAESGAPSPK